MVELERQAAQAEAQCPDCGTVLSIDGDSRGLCPACLMALALDSPTLLSEILQPSEAPTLGLPEQKPGDGLTGGLVEGQVQGDRYRIRSLLGRGGMGEVWRAYDLKLRQDVAIKSLRQELLEDPRALETLRQEVRAAREVISPNVCRVFDLQELDGQELVSMEYIDGVTLHEVLVERSPLELDEAREIASQFLAGLEAIHDADLVHQDIKPENIMVTRTGRVVVMDFGLAKTLQEGGSGQIAGTPAYMSPEQSGGGDQDARSDVYSAGVVLAEMVAPGGIRNFEDRQRVWRGIHRERPKIEESPWSPLLGRAVDSDPGVRFASAAELARALEEVTLRAVGDDSARPYPGLSVFQVEDAEYFFGRELEVEALWKKLRRPHLLAVIGPSGAGKSSFLRAGLLPTLTDGWGAIVATPGSRPFANLARALAPELIDTPDHTDRLLRFEEPEIAVDLISEWRSQHHRALIILDQFEELFTQSPEQVQESFAELLGRLPLEADVHVLLAMRDDFLFHCHRFEAFRPILSDLTLLGPPTGASLRRAIVQPALKCGYRFEDESLVEAMLGEVEGERGSLPMVAFAATKLWEARDREQGLLTRATYESIGGVGGALAQHAEATLDQIGEANIPIVRELFRNLVTAQGTRAARDRDELLSVFAEQRGHDQKGHAPSTVLDTLIDARLLTSYEVSATEEHEIDHTRIEIIHESLLNAWPRLVRWQMQDAEGAKLRDELRHQAHLWQEKGRPDDLLWTGTAFREYQLWHERYPGGLTGLEESFGAAMTSLAEQRLRRRRLATTGAFILLLVVLSVVGFYWRRSEISRRLAEAETLRAEASKLVALAQVQLQTDPTEALAYTTASLELADSLAARSFMMKVLWEAPPAFVLESPGLDMASVRFSPEGGRVAIGAFSDAAKVWLEDGQGPVLLGGLDVTSECINSGRWISEGLLVIGWCPAGGRAERVRIWSIPEGQLVRTIEFGAPTGWQVEGHRLHLWTFFSDQPQGQEGNFLLRSQRLPDGEPEDLGWIDWKALGASSAIFDPSGDSLIYAKDRTIYARPLPVATEGRDRLIGTHDADGVRLVIYALNGDRLVSIDGEGELRMWSLSAPGAGPLQVIPRPEGLTAPFSFFPDPTGQWVYRDRNSFQMAKGLLWDVSKIPGAQPLELRRSGSWQFSSFGFHPKGDWLAVTTGGASETSFWPLRKEYPTVITGASSRRKGLAFSPDSRWLATRWPGGTRILPLHQTDAAEVPKLGEESLFSNLIFDSSGKRLSGGAYGGRLSVVSLDGGESQRLEGFQNETLIESVAFSPSGRLVAAGSGISTVENTLRVWNLNTAEMRAFDLPKSETSESSADEVSQPGISDVYDVYGENVQNLWFTDEETLFTVGITGFLRWNLEDGSSQEVVAMDAVGYRTAAASTDGQKVLVIETSEGHEGNICATPELYDLAAGTAESLASFGECVRVIALGPSGTVAVTGDSAGIIRVGRTAGGEPHLLAGHEGAIEYVAVSPDLRWVASSGSDNTLRLWPMPHLSQPPLHTLPHSELLTKLRSLTNLRAVEDPVSPSGWNIEIGPFPGWEEVPTW